jgi:Domain of unknown function (DUF5753)
MRAQGDHLLAMSERPHIAIQIIPDSKGPVCAHGKDFLILTFNSANKRPRAPVAYLEGMRTARYIREKDEVGMYATGVDQGSGYRYYDPAQLEEARLVVMMRGPQGHAKGYVPGLVAWTIAECRPGSAW